MKRSFMIALFAIFVLLFTGCHFLRKTTTPEWVQVWKEDLRFTRKAPQGTLVYIHDASTKQITLYEIFATTADIGTVVFLAGATSAKPDSAKLVIGRPNLKMNSVLPFEALSRPVDVLINDDAIHDYRAIPRLLRSSTPTTPDLIRRDIEQLLRSSDKTI